jgi:outer membrane protein assembly factor BamB
VANGVVYLGSGFDVAALDAASGALLWDRRIGNGSVFSPAIVNGTVYVTSLDREVFAFGLP